MKKAAIACGLILAGATGIFAAHKTIEADRLRNELNRLKSAVRNEAIMTSVEANVIANPQVPIVGSCTEDETEVYLLMEHEGGYQMVLPICSDSCLGDRLSVSNLLHLKAQTMAEIINDDEARSIVNNLRNARENGLDGCQPEASPTSDGLIGPI